MGGFIFKIVIASLIAYASYCIYWWAPALSLPIAFFIIPAVDRSDSYAMRRSSIEFKRTLFYSFCIAFTVVMAVLFQKRLGLWYGWLMGAIVAWVDCGVIASALEKDLCFRTRGF